MSDGEWERQLWSGGFAHQQPLDVWKCLCSQEGIGYDAFVAHAHQAHALDPRFGELFRAGD